MRWCKTLFIPALAAGWIAPGPAGIASGPGDPPGIEAELGSQTPVDYYREAYRAFEFITESAFSPAGGDATLLGRSAVRYDDSGNIHLIRSLLGGEPYVEMICVDRRYFIRRSPDAPFRRSSYQSEFDRLINAVLLDVFAPLLDSGTGSSMPPATGDEHPCRKAGGNTLCIEPSHRLPSRGEVTLDTENGRLVVRFSARPLPPGTDPVQPPNQG